MMTIHVFVGVGPANLHRALKIQKIDPNAKLIFIDNRINETTRIIDRESARANIFRFETDEVTDKLIHDGIRKEDLEPLIYNREFHVLQGFQEGDDRVFSNKPFTQIQIRDLQILFMQTIDRKAKRNYRPIMVSKKLNIENEDILQKEITALLYEHREELEINNSSLDLQLHMATGALRGNAKKAEIIYPDKVSHQMQGATDDIQALTITPLHGTTTFFIPKPYKNFLDQLKNNQRSLDLTPWQSALEKFGWSLVRPPRIRVFYCNDVLYIGAEIPAELTNIKNNHSFEEQVTEYTRTIASLVFPDLPIATLPVNPFLRSRFPTSRGERGEVIINKSHQKLSWADNQIVDANVTVFNHGDNRYLPHYQTGSGFVTAFLINELYEEVYRRQTFESLVNFANDKLRQLAEAHHEPYQVLDVDKIIYQYMKLTQFNENEALEAFRKELFMTFSRDIIDENKKKVGRYLNAIHTQALNALGNNLDRIITIYNNHHGTHLTEKMFQSFSSSQIIIELLKTNNINFLKEIMPQLLNAEFNFDQLLNKEETWRLLTMRDVHLQDFEHNLDLSKEEEQQRVANQHGIQGIITNNFQEKVAYITSKPEFLVQNITNIAESLKNNKILHQRRFISFFTGVHSARINKFAAQIHDLTEKYSHNPNELQKMAQKALLDFHHDLEKGHSKRTIKALQDLVQQTMESTQIHTNVSPNF